MSVMAISVTDGTHMVSPELWVLPMLSRTLGILFRRVNAIIIRRIGMLDTSLVLVVTSIPTSLIPSLTLLIIRGRLVREVLLCVDLTCRIRRSRGLI